MIFEVWVNLEFPFNKVLDTELLYIRLEQVVRVRKDQIDYLLLLDQHNWTRDELVTYRSQIFILFRKI